MSSGLEKLPDELLEMIVQDMDDSYTEDNDRSRDFRALCLSSKGLRNIAIPYLYKVVRIHDSDGVSRLLARILCNDPSLAEHCRGLIVKPCKEIQPPPTAIELALFIKQIEPLRGGAVFDQLSTALKTGCQTAELLVLLTLNTHIRSLWIAVHDYDNSTDGVEKTLCQLCPDVSSCLRAIPPHWTFPRLGSATAFGRPSMGSGEGSPCAALSPLFSLPSLKSLEASGFGTVESTQQWMVSPKTSAVENIRLDLGALNTFDAVEILSFCNALRKCDIRWAAFDSPDEEDDDDELLDCELDAEALLTALVPHADTLERLVLTNIQDAGCIFEGKSPFVSLRPFHKLTKLKIDEYLLVSHGAWDRDSLRGRLPPKLVKLVIHSNSGFDCLGGLLEACSEYHGHLLNDLKIMFYPEDEWLHDEFGELYEKNQSADDRSWFIGFNSYEHQNRLAFKCWAQPMSPLLSELAALVADNGLSHLTYMQLTPADADGTVLETASFAALAICEDEKEAKDDTEGS